MSNYIFSFILLLFFQLSRRRTIIDLLKKNWAQTNLIHLCNFFSPNFRNSCTVNSNTKSPDRIKGSDKTIGKLNIDTYPHNSIQHIRSAYQQMGQRPSEGTFFLIIMIMTLQSQGYYACTFEMKHHILTCKRTYWSKQTFHFSHHISWELSKYK